MNIIFLDIDGVLNNAKFTPSMGGQLWDHTGWDTQCLECLDYIIEHLPEVKFVLSSTWRQLYTLKEIEAMFVERLGYTPNFVGITPIHLETDSGWATRGDEIQSFIDNTDMLVDNYVIIDDDSDFKIHQLPYFVQTSWNTGLTLEHAQAVVELFHHE